MLRTILIDDEEQWLDAMEKDLEKYCSQDVEVVAKCSTALTGLKAIKNFKPDLIILDVELKGKDDDTTGFEMLELVPDINFEVIFFTNHPQYALKAFEYSAVHFLWKMNYTEKLVKAIERVKHKRAHNDQLNRQQIDALLYNLQTENQNKRIGLPIGDGYTFVNMLDIMYAEADGNLAYVYLPEGKKLHISRSLGKLTDLLSNEQEAFMRIHDKFLANKYHIQKYKRGDGGEAIMKDGKSLPVSRRKREEFKKWMGIND